MASGAPLPLRSPSLPPRQRRASLDEHLPDMSATFTELEFRNDEPRNKSEVSGMPATVGTLHARTLSEPDPPTQGANVPVQPDHTISPFLKTHIPHQYNPLGPLQGAPEASNDKSSTRYCYRHRPDLKCRRQANEPSMEQLQKELGELPPSDQQGISHVWSLFSAAPSRHRNLMLQGILAQCCFPQLSYISASVRDLVKIDFLSVLPAELGLKILCYLDPTSICKAAQVSRRWRSLADDDVVWHRMCEQHIDRKCTKCGWGLPLLDRKRLRTEKRQIQLRASGHHDLDHIPRVSALAHEMEQHVRHAHSKSQETSTSTSTCKKRGAENLDEGEGALEQKKRLASAESNMSRSRKQAWKDVYRDRFKIGNNWKKDRYHHRTFKGHTNGVMAVQFDDNIIASGSYDSTIKIWDIASGEEIRTLFGHTMPIRCLQFDESKLISGSLDNTIKIWNLHTGELLRTLNGHTDGVISLHFDGALVASGSKDRTIRIWNFKDMSVSTLHGHQDWVNCVKLDTPSRTLLSASDDCTIRLWDLDNKRCLREFGGHVAQVQQVVPMPRGFEPDCVETTTEEAVWTWPNGDAERPAPPRYIISGALSGNIRMWDIFTGTCIRTFFGHIEGVWGLAADTLRVVSGANDGMIKVWDPRTGICERTYTNHAGPVTCVGLSDRRMCSGSEDHEVSLFDFCD